METTIPKPFVFVLMPFEDKFDDVYQLGIKSACEKAGAYVERVDEQVFQESIFQRIYNQISKADIIVSDMTGRNPNVFYETGYAHALGKNVILITKNKDDIPFDLIHYPHIIYKGKINDLIPELQKRVQYFIENPPKSMPIIEQQLSFYIKEKSIADETILYFPAHNFMGKLSFKLNAFNSPEINIKTMEYDIAFITSKNIERFMIDAYDRDNSVYSKRANLPDGRICHIIKKRYSLLPGAWESSEINVNFNGPLQPTYSENITLRVMTENDVIDYSFKINISSDNNNEKKLSEPLMTMIE